MNNELTTLGYTVGDDLDININIENFNEGNRALRYWVGFGAGKATSKIVTTLVDKESGKIVGNIQTDGMLSMGVLGGNSKDVLSERHCQKNCRIRYFEKREIIKILFSKNVLPNSYK